MTESQCPVCSTPVPSDQGKYALCEHCEIPHHPECFAHNGHCGIYGCKGKRSIYEKKNTALISVEQSNAPKVYPTLDILLAEYTYYDNMGFSQNAARNRALDHVFLASSPKKK